MFKRIIVSFLVILAVGFTFVSCDSDKGKAVPIETFSAKETPLTLENYGSSDMKVTIQFSNLTASDSKLKYSIDDGEIQDVTLSSSVDITVPAGKTISFYDDRSSTTGASTLYTIQCDTECYVYGNVMSLINSTDFKDLTSLENHAFVFTKLLFKNTNIIDHPKKALVLPATKLATSCYANMFEDCTGITKAPELPAESLARGCYASMFSGCSGLTAAPKLPAENLEDNCYYFMFQKCTNLKKAPDLPAKKMKGSCYYSMFLNCSSLTSAPALPAEELANNCYNNMFRGCTELTEAPDLPANILATRCYEGMFWACTGLTTAPELRATYLAYGCYSYMFAECTSLTTAPTELPAEISAPSCYSNMFQYCTALTTSPKNLADSLSSSCCVDMFKGCTQLSSVTCLAKSSTSSDSTLGWLSGVASTGTFTKSAAATFWESDSASGIPAGWSVNNM